MNTKKVIPILLTASVDPHGMVGAKFTVEVREQMYVDTLLYYISLFMNDKGVQPLVFCENSGWFISSICEKVGHFPENVPIEYISINPELFDNTKGKGYNEFKMIDIALEQSDIVKQYNCFFKVTGRFPILNVNNLLMEVKNREVFRADCKDHRVYEWLHIPINGHVGECRFFYCTNDFYKQYFRGRYSELNDYEGRIAEMLMLDVIRSTKGQPGVSGRYRTQPLFSGCGGHSLGTNSKGWRAFFYSTDNDSLALRLKGQVRQLCRWIFPFWWC